MHVFDLRCVYLSDNRTMLSAYQIKLAKTGFDLGMADTRIATLLGGEVKAQWIYALRHKIGLSSGQIKERRYTAWERLLCMGHSVLDVASLYGVQVETVRHALYITRKLSVSELLRRGEEQRESGKFVKISWRQPLAWGVKNKSTWSKTSS
jgi:hypothetical protein